MAVHRRCLPQPTEMRRHLGNSGTRIARHSCEQNQSATASGASANHDEVVFAAILLRAEGKLQEQRRWSKISLAASLHLSSARPNLFHRNLDLRIPLLQFNSCRRCLPLAIIVWPRGGSTRSFTQAPLKRMTLFPSATGEGEESLASVAACRCHSNGGR